MNQSWMDLECHICEEFISGVSAFMSAARSNMLATGGIFMHCPCLDCKNKKKFENTAQVHSHLILRGFTKGYKC